MSLRLLAAICFQYKVALNPQNMSVIHRCVKFNVPLIHESRNAVVKPMHRVFAVLFSRLPTLTRVVTTDNSHEVMRWKRKHCSRGVVNLHMKTYFCQWLCLFQN
jgi:hypothetical protein